MATVAETRQPAETRPRHQQLYDVLRAQIEDGAFVVGQSFPTEEQLCADHQVSRYALREALLRLEKEGYIRRRRGAGTTVLSRTPTHVFRHAIGSRADLLRYAHATRIDWSDYELVRTDGQLARLLGCDELREWHSLQGVRYEEDGQILGMVRVYVDTTRATVAESTDFQGGPIYEWLEKNYDLRPAGLSQDMRAKPLTANEAEVLGEIPGACSLQIIRRYFDPGNAIYLISVNTYRSRDFVYNMRLQLQN